MRSFIALSILTSPIRNWFSRSSPTLRTLRLPRWSISSGITSLVPLRSFTRYCIMATISSFMRTRASRGGSSPPIRAFSSFSSLTLSLSRPTLERSYRSSEKNRRSKCAFAVSRVGGSPGLSLRYISSKASSWLSTLSEARVSLREDSYLLLSKKISSSSPMPATIICSNISSVIRSLQSAIISPVETSTTGEARYLSTIST